MGLELRQQLKLSQQLVMTPQLQQAIKLLQMSRLELLETVNKELLENPLLEEEQVEEAEDQSKQKEVEELAQGQPSDEDMIEATDWEDYLGEFSSTARQVQMREAEAPEEMMSFESRYSAKPSLQSHLAWQLNLSDMTEIERRIGEEVIGNLDSVGYLQSTVDEIAQITGSSPEKVEEVLKKIQHFDPLGVAARDVPECLVVQLEAYEYDDPVLFEIVKNHLKDLEKRQYKVLTKKFKIKMEDVKEILDIIHSLEPMPGASYGGSEAQYVSPDVYVYKYDEDFIIVLNEEGLPKLQMNPFYMEEIKAKNSKDKEYLQDKLRSAQWLMKSLYQRQRTLFKVSESLVKFQREFFEQGVSGLKPLILRDVAEDIEMHESTVSRITSNKYMATPHGVFELKFFFNSALDGEGGDQVGSESVKASIKQIVSGEDPKHPISDEKIAAMLKDKLQVNIARRTVAKYRAALDIPSSSKRKKIF